MNESWHIRTIISHTVTGGRSENWVCVRESGSNGEDSLMSHTMCDNSCVAHMDEVMSHI